jgi:hypothetical protein
LDVTDLWSDIRVIADSLAVQWPGIESDDIAQHMGLKLSERWESLRPGNDAERKMILSFAKREGVAYCSTERHYWQVQTSEWIYTPREVRHLLAAMFTELPYVDTPKRPSKGKEYLTADGVSVVLMDIRNAYEAVSVADQAEIRTAFLLELKPTDGAGKKRLERAVANVTDRLNWYMHSIAQGRDDHDGPGSRTAMSNAAARYATGTNY